MSMFHLLGRHHQLCNVHEVSNRFNKTHKQKLLIKLFLLKNCNLGCQLYKGKGSNAYN